MTSGDIHLDTEADSFTLDFKAKSGDGEIDVPGFMFEEKIGNRFVGQIGDGKSSITVRVTSGDFQLN